MAKGDLVAAETCCQRLLALDRRNAKPPRHAGQDPGREPANQ